MGLSRTEDRELLATRAPSIEQLLLGRDDRASPLPSPVPCWAGCSRYSLLKRRGDLARTRAAAPVVAIRNPRAKKSWCSVRRRERNSKGQRDGVDAG